MNLTLSSGSASITPAPKSGSLLGGSSPSKPKSPALAPPPPPPPKAPKVPSLPKIPSLPKPPKLPKPKSGWNPPKGSIPGFNPGHAPYHGSGGHGDHVHDHDQASPNPSCIHPKGMDRLRCDKADAVVGLLFAIIGFFLVPFLIYRCVMRYKMSKKKYRHEEDGLELAGGGMNCDPGERTHRGALVESPDQESFKSAKEEREHRSVGNGLGQKLPPAYQPRKSSGSSRSGNQRSMSSRDGNQRCVSSSGSQKGERQRSERRRSESQKSERPGNGSQNNESPRNMSQRSGSLRSENPGSGSPRSGSPRSGSPRSGSPRCESPRCESPRFDNQEGETPVAPAADESV